MIVDPTFSDTTQVMDLPKQGILGPCQGHHPLVEDETNKWARQAVAESRGVSVR
jgi:hypothetical protein